jgi:hypothetical protein
MQQINLFNRTRNDRFMRTRTSSLKTFLALTFIGVVALFSNSLQAQFTSGNLAVFVAAASASNTTGSIVQINTSSAGQSAITTNAIDGTTAAIALRFSGSATSTGYLSTSDDGTLLSFTGGQTTTAGATNINTILLRGVGTYNAAGTFNLAATYTGTSGNQTRGATSLNNTNWYVGDQGGLFTNGASAASPSGTNLRATKSFGGTVYGLVSTTTAFPVGTFSAITGGTYTPLNGTVTATAPSDFYLVSSGSNGSAFDVLYMVGNTSATVGTIFKYSLVSGSWVANGTYTTAFGGFGLAAKKSGAGAELYVTSGTGATAANSVIRLIDVNGYNSAINITTASNVTLYTSVAGTLAKGISFVPVAANASIAVSSPAQIGAANISQGAVNQVVSQFQAAVTVSNATLNSISCAVAGTIDPGTADISNLKLFYNSASNSFAGATQIGSTQTGNGVNTYNFNSLGTTINNGSTGYFFIVASINAAATAGNTFNISASPTLTFAAGTVTGSITAGGTQTIQAAVPTISISNGVVNAGNINQNSINNVLYRADVTVSVTGANLNAATFTTAGTYLASDLTNLKLWYSTSPTFATGTSTLLNTKTSGLGAGNQVFGAGGQGFASGVTAYLFVTADLNCTSTLTNTIAINAISSPSNFVFASGTPTGSGFTAGGTQTIIAGVSAPANATVPVASGSGVTGIVNVSWTAPLGCYDEVMIVAATATNTGVPTGNGSAYAPNATFGSGTALGNGFVVYKGTGSPQAISGLTDGTTYFFKIYTRYNSGWSTGIEASGAPFKIIASTDVIVPQYMQGVNGTNSNRVPSAFRVTLSGLNASATYRYFNQVVIATDLPSANGAGNPIFTAAGGFSGTSSPSLSTVGSYGTFTTDASGNYTGWFAVEPTGNATRFVPGNNVFMRINMNDGNNGTVVVGRATTTNSAIVKNLGVTATDATGIRSTTGASPRDFICLYDNTAGTGRPISATYVESDGYGNIASHAAFYSGVEAVAGAWGTIIPNNLATGVRRIESRSFATGSVLCSYTGNGAGLFGAVNTVSPTGGTAALTIPTAQDPMDCTNLTLDHTNIAQTTSILMGISTNDNVLSNFRISNPSNTTTLNGISFNIGGTIIAGDVVQFSLYTSTTNTFPGGTALATVPAASIAGGGLINFSSLNQTIASGDRYFWITGDFTGAGTGRNLVVPALDDGFFSFASNAIIFSNTISIGGTMTLGTPIPLIVISSAPTVAGSIFTGASNSVLYRTDISVSVTSTQLNTVTLNTAGSYLPADISNLKLYYQPGSLFNAGTATLLGTISAGLGSGPKTFTGLTQSLPVGTGYLFLTADVPCSSALGNGISVSAAIATNFDFSAGTPTGTGSTGGTQTITASTPSNVASPAAIYTGSNGAVSVSWSAAPGCTDEVLIVAATSANTGIPTGNGSLYTANSVYATGTALGNGFVVYKGTISPQVFTGMINGTQYFFKIYTRVGNNWSAGVEVTATPTLVASLTEVIVPQFIQGVNGTNNNRLPYVYRVTINNLLPNATYRYFNGVVLPAEAATSNGAGNVIFTDTPTWTKVSSPGLSTAGTYGQFLTDGSGSYTGWFVTEPTGNATRFVPGNQVIMRIMLNDGAGGTTVASRVSTTSTARVVNLVASAGANNATGIKSLATNANAKDFVCLYDNITGTGRPISVTYIENDGTVNSTAASYASFYGSTVDGISGSWGTLIPNTLSNGVQRIETRAFTTGAIIGCTATDSDGIWPTGTLGNTVNPITGTVAKEISNADAPLDPAALTFYLDADLDGYYFGTPVTACTSPGAGYTTTVSLPGDCLDNNALVNPAATEVCFNSIDDNCNGFTDEGCTPPVIPNDNRAQATFFVGSGNAYPLCSTLNGTCLGAVTSPEGTAANVVTGEDVWYRFVAASSGVRVVVNTTSFNSVIELQNSTGTQLNVENITGVGGTEILNYSGLVEGNTYYVAVRNFNSALGNGPFTICIQSLMDSRCGDGSGTYNLCTSFKPLYAGANSYTFNFTPTLGGSTTSSTVPGSILLSLPALALQYGVSYNVTVDATFNLLNGLGATESITIIGTDACTVAIGTQTLTEVKASQRCPATLYRAALLSAKPFVCGAVDYEFEFTETTSLGVPVGMTFTKLRGAATPYLQLNFTSPTALVSGSYYSVRIRPVFVYGPGVYGAPQCIQISPFSNIEVTDFGMQERSEEEEAQYNIALYPNPIDGKMVYLNIAGLDADYAQIRIVDGLGKLVHNENLQFEGSLSKVITFENELHSGVYTVQVVMAGKSFEKRMVVVN